MKPQEISKNTIRLSEALMQWEWELVRDPIELVVTAPGPLPKGTSTILISRERGGRLRFEAWGAGTLADLFPDRWKLEGTTNRSGWMQ
jgi:hypothetical protein